jgi:hypothetical protein
MRRAFVVTTWILAAAANAAHAAHAAAAPTHADLQTERRRAAVLESEVALASTRKPYLVLDLQAKALRYRLMGMTMREIPVPDLSIEGLVSSEEAADAPVLAGSRCPPSRWRRAPTTRTPPTCSLPSRRRNTA